VASLLSVPVAGFANTHTIHTVPAIRALVKFDVSANSLCAAGAKSLAKALKDNPIMTELNIAHNSLGKVGTHWNDDSDMSGVIAIGNAMGALTSLNISNNKLATKDAGKALAHALASNSVLKELDVSSNDWDEGFGDNGDGPGFAQELADGVKNNGALTSLNISNNSLARGKYTGGDPSLDYETDMSGASTPWLARF
jgi:Leucine-rich repeat (LRR) protein